MKTSLKVLMTSAMTAIILSATVFTSVAGEKVVVLEKVSTNPDIKKVIVKGNTKVLLVQSNTEWVSMDEDYLDKVSIQQIGNTLSICSFEKIPVTVTVYVRDLYRIDVSNAVNIMTVGKFNLKYLQLILRDNAVALIKANTESLYTDMDGRANLELLGKTESHTIKNAGIGNLNMERFAALKTENIPAESRLAMNPKGTEAKKTGEDTFRK